MKTFICKQCGKEGSVYSDPQSYITLNFSRNYFAGHGTSEMHFCDADCAIAFLEQSDNHRRLVWVPKGHLTSQFENECLQCLRDNKSVNNPGPHLSIAGGCDTWYDDGCGPEYFCSVEHLIESLRLQQAEFKSFKKS